MITPNELGDILMHQNEIIDSLLASLIELAKYNQALLKDLQEQLNAN